MSRLERERLLAEVSRLCRVSPGPAAVLHGDGIELTINEDAAIRVIRELLHGANDGIDYELDDLAETATARLDAAERGAPIVPQRTVGDAKDEYGRRTKIPAKVKRAVLERDGNRCKKCRNGDADLELHHIVEVVAGGRHELENIDTLCAPCHGEWTWSPPADVTYAEWLALPPARMFAAQVAQAMRDHRVASGMAGVTAAEWVQMIRAAIRERA